MYARFGKRALDVTGATALLVALAPAMGAVALLVRLSLGRPVLFCQVRAGRGGAPFNLFKFRTMRDGPEEDALRLTRTGRLLRRFALDELPQLVNVLRGEMSLVGPRPLPLAYVPLYTPAQARRLEVRPGLAGAAQAAGRNVVPWEARLAIDAAYAAAPLRLGRDMALLARCALLALRGQGASAPGHATMPEFRPDPDITLG